MAKKEEEHPVNRYMRERIRQLRLAAHESQGDLANELKKSRVAISDIERGRVTVSAVDLAYISSHYDKPIGYFYPPRISVSKEQLSQLEEQLVYYFSQLPPTQQRIALEYVKQQMEITIKAEDGEFSDQYALYKSKNKKKS
jgi:transcriptional regulator with XRE-family HTH domain